jgi:large subunit ribosomal protein L31e
MSDSEIDLDRTYTVPLSRAWIAPRHRRTARAVNVLKEFAERHMKSSEIKIDSKLNEKMWGRGITKPPRRITVRMTKDEDGLVTISLPKEAKTDEEEGEITPAESTSAEVENEQEKEEKSSAKEKR